MSHLASYPEFRVSSGSASDSLGAVVRPSLTRIDGSTPSSFDRGAMEGVAQAARPRAISTITAVSVSYYLMSAFCLRLPFNDPHDKASVFFVTDACKGLGSTLFLMHRVKSSAHAYLRAGELPLEILQYQQRYATSILFYLQFTWNVLQQYSDDNLKEEPSTSILTQLISHSLGALALLGVTAEPP
ncbi:hypothetical protein BV25DRAFT_1840109 [Artomyces pyxidatus]|uniref:Uncharacterized protein n=1 Tax=Artomyces pyxidatus TaxID=48021 RepID=A0ACB8ST33_9AGAM|nr:hypothetical protein BV25DRAFT_1840109 [Artomyces pyxidatus]